LSLCLSLCRRGNRARAKVRVAHVHQDQDLIGDMEKVRLETRERKRERERKKGTEIGDRERGRLDLEAGDKIIRGRRPVE
jgi:hypothetical protein